MSPRTLRLRWCTTLLLAVAATALLAGGAIAAVDAGANDERTTAISSPVAQDDGSPVEPCAAEMPDDYEDPPGSTSETIGWADGVWYDEPLDLNATDGFSDRELDRYVARTAARAEVMRCLAFQDGLPPVEIVTRAEHANDSALSYVDTVRRDERRYDAKYATLLAVPDDRSAVNVTRVLLDNGVYGYYDNSEERIVIVAFQDTDVPISESTLFQELGHALQDQHFDLSREYETTDRENAWTGLVEGDINYLNRLYSRHCRNDNWERDCIAPESTNASENQAVPSWGLGLEFQYPYLEGPPFVQQVYRQGGWDAVDELYEDGPETAMEVIAPNRTADAEFVDPDIDVAATGEWERLSASDGSETDEVGAAWIAGTFMAPSFETEFQQNVVETTDIYNLGPDGNASEIAPINYGLDPALGWRGDTMAFYGRGNDTATVWKSAWTNETEATEFADAYERLLEVRGANASETHAQTFTFDDESGYDGAVAVVTEGDRVTIVSTPSVDATDAIAPELPADENGTGGTDGGNESEDDGDSLPGFGVAGALVAVVALIAGALLARRSR